MSRLEKLDLKPLGPMDIVGITSRILGKPAKQTHDRSVALGQLLSACRATFGEELGEHTFTMISRGQHTADSAIEIVEEAFAMNDADTAPAKGKRKKAAVEPIPSKAAPKAKAKVAAPRDEDNGRQRPSKYEGKFIHPLVSENPRRKSGGFGHQSMELVLANPGISVSEYLSRGGRLQDLDWDVKHGSVKVSDQPQAKGSRALAQRAAREPKRTQRWED